MDSAAREQRVFARVRELARDRRALRTALDQFADAEDFARVWASEDALEINRRDQLERPYERIVNHVQEIIDFCEQEEAAQEIPGPPEPDAGRWRRVAQRGYLRHAQAERWQRLARGRQRLAHHYADLPASQGREIFEQAQELAGELPRTMGALSEWIEKLWPFDWVSGTESTTTFRPE